MPREKVNNIRAAGHDEAIRLTTPIIPTLDTALEWIDEEELVEITPKSAPNPQPDPENV